MKCTAALALVALLSMSLESSAALIVAGWDAWDSTTAPNPSVTAPGVSASASASAATGDWNESEGSGRGSSKDGTWGTFDGNGVAASTVTSGAGLNFSALSGVTDAQISLTLENTSGDAIILEAVHFDAISFRPNAPRSYAVNILSGDLTTGNVFTSDAPLADNSTNAITHLGGALAIDDADPTTHDQHDDINVSLIGLADNVLAAGESAVLQIEFFNGTGSGGGHHLFLDNVAVSGAAVPEPASAGLVALLLLAGKVIRRDRIRP